MSWDIAISRQINVPFEAGDVAEFVRLLRIHPNYLRHADGTDLWMWRAAMHGRLEIIKALFDLGLDVNTPKSCEDPNDPYCTPEGPILQAATEGNVETVRWLLSHGAKINYIVHGKSRCLPLLDAAANGHLDIVRLIVENGADIHCSFNGLTPLSQATNYGHSDIADYLRSVGAIA